MNMVNPTDNLPSQRSSRDYLDEGYTTPRQNSFIIHADRRGSSDHIQPSMPSPGEIRSMFSTGVVCEFPEYQRSPSNLTDPTEWRSNDRLDDLGEKLLKIQQWSSVTSNEFDSSDDFRPISRRGASHQMFRNAQENVHLFWRSDREFSDQNGNSHSSDSTQSSVNEDSQAAMQSSKKRNSAGDQITGETSNDADVPSPNRESNTSRSEERFIHYILDSKESESNDKLFMKNSLNKEPYVSKLCDIVQSLRRVYEDNKKACHVVKRLLEIFNLNHDINGKLEGDTKTILKEKFCRFIEHSEPKLDTYKDINKLFELLESGITADEESTLQSTLENLCMKLNPELNCLRYEATAMSPSCCAPSEQDVLTNEKDEVVIKLHNLSSDLSVTILEECDGKTSVVGQSIPKRDKHVDFATQKSSKTKIPVSLSRISNVKKQEEIIANESGAPSSSKQNMLLKKNTRLYKVELFKKAVSLGLAKNVEELEKSCKTRSQIVLLEKRVNGKLKSIQLAEERKKLGAPERINNKSLSRKKQLSEPAKTPEDTSQCSTENIVIDQQHMAVTDEVDERFVIHNSPYKKRKIILDIVPLRQRDEGVIDLKTDKQEHSKPLKAMKGEDGMDQTNTSEKDYSFKDSNSNPLTRESDVNERLIPYTVPEEGYELRSTHSEPISSQTNWLESNHSDSEEELSKIKRSWQKKNYNFSISLFFIFFIVTLLYAACVYGNFEFYSSKIEKFQNFICSSMSEGIDEQMKKYC